MLTIRRWQQASLADVSHHVPLAVLVLLAITSALLAMQWGLPDGASPESTGPWAVDTIAPLGPLIEAYHRFTRAGLNDVIYPLFHYIVLACAYVPYVAFAFVTGALQNPSGDFPYGATNPAEFFAHLNWIASLVSAVMFGGIVVTIFLIARDLFGRSAALWAAAFTVLVPPLTYYGTTSNLDVPYLFWTMLAVLHLVRAAQTGAVRNYVWCAVFAALATATKDQAAGFFVALPVLMTLIAARARQREGRPLWPFGLLTDRRLILAAAVVVFVFAMANNLLFGGLEGFKRHLAFADEFYANNLASLEHPFLIRQATLFGRSTLLLLEMVGPAVIVLALIGMWRALRERHFVALLLPLLGLVYYVCIIAPTTSLSRYLLGMVLLSMPFAGAAAAHAFSEGGAPMKRLAAALAVVACGWQLVLVANVHNLLRNDSRYAMEAWVRENVEPGAHIESSTQARYLPRLADQYTYDIVGNSFDAISYRLRGHELTLSELEKRRPEYIMVLSDSGLSGDPRRLLEPELQEYYAALLENRAGYETVAKFSTPSWLPYRQFTVGVAPETVLLKRTPGS